MSSIETMATSHAAETVRGAMLAFRLLVAEHDAGGEDDREEFRRVRREAEDLIAFCIARGGR